MPKTFDLDFEYCEENGLYCNRHVASSGGGRAWWFRGEDGTLYGPFESTVKALASRLRYLREFE